MSTQIQGRARKGETYALNEYPIFRIEPEKRNQTHPMSTQIQGRARKEESSASNEYPNTGLSQKRGFIHTQ
jgi:hypothetical protein